MTVLLEIMIGAILSAFMTTGEIEQEHSAEETKPEQVIEVTVPEKCEESI